MSISDFAEEKPKQEATEWTSENEKTLENTTESASSVESSEKSKKPLEETSPVSSTPASPAPTTDSILDGILSKIGDIGRNAPLKMMVYGPPGGTKSSFSATAENALITDFEDGLVSALASPNGVGSGTQSIPYTGFSDFVTLIRALKNNEPRLAKFDTYVIDTFSDLHKQGLAEVVTREYRKRPASGNEFVAETEHHVENNEKLLRIIRALRDMDRNLIIVSHSKTVEPKNKPAKTYADFSESLSNKIMAMMDIVGYMEMQKTDEGIIPVMRFTSDGTIAAKSRIKLPETVANPTFPKVLNAWNKALNGTNSVS